jgi:hypothetical protein
MLVAVIGMNAVTTEPLFAFVIRSLFDRDGIGSFIMGP